MYVFNTQHPALSVRILTRQALNKKVDRPGPHVYIYACMHIFDNDANHATCRPREK